MNEMDISNADKIVNIKSNTIFYVKNQKDFTVIVSNGQIKPKSLSVKSKKVVNNTSINKILVRDSFKRISFISKNQPKNFVSNKIKFCFISNNLSNSLKKIYKLTLDLFKTCFRAFYPLLIYINSFKQNCLHKTNLYLVFTCISRPPPIA